MRRFADRASILVACLVATLALSVETVVAYDMVRFVNKNKETGEFEEATRTGSVQSYNLDGVLFEYDSKGEKKTIELAPEQIVWLQFDDEPIEMATARVEAQVGEYENALEKIDAVQEDDVKSDRVAEELEWNRCEATAKLALSDPSKLQTAAKALSKFVANAKEHYRFYDANALLGDVAIALGRPEEAEKCYGRLGSAKSESLRARGENGLARVAFDAGDFDKAKELYSKVSESENLDAKIEGLDARTIAKIGLARVLAKQDAFDEAIRTLEELLDATPNSAIATQAKISLALGDVCAQADRPEEAIVAYLRIDLLYPAARTERVAALEALVGLWRKVGRADRAAETRQILLERFNVDLD